MNMSRHEDFAVQAATIGAASSKAPSPWSRVGVADILPLVMRRWRLAASVFGGVLVVGLAGTLVLPERYTATAQVTIDPRSNQLVGAADPMAGATMMVTEIETQAKVITSQDVLMQTIADLRLWQLPEYAIAPSKTDRILSALSLGDAQATDYAQVAEFDDVPATVRSLLVEKLAGRVSSYREGLTSVVAVEATSEDPALAARIANAITASYLDKQIDSGVATAQRAASYLEDRVSALSAQVGERERALAAYEARKKMDPERVDQSEEFRIRKDLDTSRVLYANYGQRLEEVRQQTALNLSNSRVVAEAIVPTTPSFPPRSLFALAVLMAAMGSAAGVTILRESIVGGFHNEEQFELVTGYELLGVVPESAMDKPCKEIVADTFSHFSESIRRLRVGIAMRRGKEGGVVVLVTSSEPSEGKSTLSMSLAHSFADAGKRVIIVDADLRRPSLNGMVGNAANQGMIDFFCEDKDASYTKVDIGNGKTIDFIGGGSGHGTSTDNLVGSERFRDLVDSLKADYDVVILDTPPINYVVDSKVMAQYVDAAVYVVRQSGPSQRSVMQGLKQMAGALAVRDKPVLPVLYGVKRAGKKKYAYYGNQHRA